MSASLTVILSNFELLAAITPSSISKSLLNLIILDSEVQKNKPIFFAENSKRNPFMIYMDLA